MRRASVRRPSLVQRLIGDGRAALALVVAPAGYGKSTLLAEWAEKDERRFLWLSGAEGAAEVCATVQAASAGGESFVVVLDDAQVAEPTSLAASIRHALRGIPSGSALVTVSRTEPLLALGRLRAHRALSEVRIEHLAMTPSEARLLLAQAGFELGSEQIEWLVRRTEGWPAALCLAAQAVQEDPEHGLEVTGGHHLIAEYLREEILLALAPNVRRFAVQTSVLDELTTAGCDVVLERAGSARLLAELARACPLLAPVDPARERYRWHGLMRDALRTELRRGDPGLDVTLHRHASSWYAQRGEPEQAIDHAAAAGDAELAGDLLLRNIVTYVATGRGELVRGWLNRLGSEQVSCHPSLALSAALSSLTAGNLNDARRWAAIVASGLEQSPIGADTRSLHSGLALVDATAARGGIAGMGDLATSVEQAEPRGSQWHPFCLFLRGVSEHLRGDPEIAARTLEEATMAGGDASPSLASLALAQLAMVAIERQDWETAAEASDRATTMLDEWKLEREPISAIVFAAAAASLARQGRVDEAKAALRSGIELLTLLGDFIPWYGTEARILLAHASLWLADVVGARTLLAEASRLARKMPDAVIFTRWFDEAWAYMDTLAEARMAGPSSLTIAELRILRFLPSHRSFREIGLHLGVSANTVKTQAHAVYRKLGAASRSEAVAHAINAGLLGQ